MKNARSAFSMIELIFVIVILGILAGVALPKLMATRDDAAVAKARSDVAAIRSSIKTVRAKRVLEGNSSYPASLDSSSGLFGAVLDYAVASSSKPGHWSKNGNKYRFNITSSEYAEFEYNKTKGIFDCDHSRANCKKLAE